MPPAEISAGLVGRENEIGQLTGLARQAVAGRGAAVLVEGEPGIGKTALLSATAAAAERLGMRVLRGAAEDLEQRVPFAAIVGCLGLWSEPADPDDLIGEKGLARIAGLLRGEGIFDRNAAAANHQYVVTEAILDLVDQWCAEGPMALILDDLQWADRASIFALHRLGRFTGELPLLMVLASRTMQLDGETAGLLRSLTSRGAQVLRLGALDEADVARLVEHLVGAPAGPELLGRVAGAGGNPLYIRELIAVLTREGINNDRQGFRDDRDGGIGGSGQMPPSLVEVILDRLDFLPAKTREVLQMAAVLGQDVDVAELSIILDLSVMELSESVAVAIAAGLLMDQGQDLVFRHDLIRQALAEHLPVPVRAALHLRASQVLAAAGAPVERVGEHLLAGTAMDRQALDWLARSADALIVRAPRLAVSLLRRAVSTIDSSELRFLLVRALLWEGSQVEAEAAARVALAALAGDRESEREGVLLWLLMQAVYRQGRLADTVAVADEAIASPRLTIGQRACFHGFAAICLFYLGQFGAGEAGARQAIAAGSAGEHRKCAGLGYLALSAVRFMQGDMGQALELNERAIAVFVQGIQPDLQADPYAMRGYCLLELDRLAEADEALATAVRHNERTGGVYLTLTHVLRAQLRFLDGRWDDALAEIQAGLDAPDPLLQTEALHGLAGLVNVHRGTWGAEGVGTSLKYGYLMRWAQALAQETRTGPREALDLLFPEWEQPGPFTPRRVTYHICADLARLAVAAGDRERCRYLAATTEKLAGDQPTGSLAGTARLCRGLAEDDPGLLLAAGRDFRQVGWPLYAAYADESRAAVLGYAGRTAQAREALEQALTGYAELDAAWDTARAEARLRQAGIRRGRSGPRKRPKSGWESLTGTESRVALLVAEGLSNPDIAAQLFLSRRTVQSHVSSILAKLDLSSRVELAVTASRRTPEA